MTENVNSQGRRVCKLFAQWIPALWPLMLSQTQAFAVIFSLIRPHFHGQRWSYELGSTVATLRSCKSLTIRCVFQDFVLTGWSCGLGLMFKYGVGSLVLLITRSIKCSIAFYMQRNQGEIYGYNLRNCPKIVRFPEPYLFLSKTYFFKRSTAVTPSLSS